MRFVAPAAMVAMVAMVPAPAQASAAAAAFDAGRFAEAATLGRREGTAASLTVAGRAQATVAVFQTADRKAARDGLLAAERDFDAALALQPGKPDALLQKAITIGYRAKLENSPGLAKAARRNFEAILARRPNDALALGAMGGWHGEAVAALGKFLAGTALGAKEGDAKRFYEKALAAPGADPVVPVFYATTLLNLSAGNAERAKGLLQRAVRGSAGDGFERLMQAHARAILKPLEAGDVAAARATAKRLAPLGTLEKLG